MYGQDETNVIKKRHVPNEIRVINVTCITQLN